MELPFEKKDPSFADLKTKGLSFRTRHYFLTSTEGLNEFTTDLQALANNPVKHNILTFQYETQVDGSPFAVLRFIDDEKVEINKNTKFTLFAKIYTKYEFNELDAIINKHDKTNLYLLGEKRFTMKTGDFFILLIWATVDKPTKFTEGLDVLRKWFIAKFS